MRIFVGVVVVVILGALAWVRLSPNNPDLWHTDPLAATPSDLGGWIVRPEGGQATADVYPPEALEMLDRIATGTPRTTRLAGSVAEGRITYLTRSAVLGFPDFTTVQALPVEGGITLAIHARQRFGSGDMGVNRTRVEGWLRDLAQALAPTATVQP